jgi:hypothetical protein
MGYVGFGKLNAGRMELSPLVLMGVIPYSLSPADADPTV